MNAAAPAMSRRLCVALAIAVAALSALAAPAADASGPLTLKRAFDRIGKIKDGGDRYISRLILFTEEGPVGTARYTCIKSKQFRPRCSVISKFSEGTIRARGRVSPTATIRIVGGSGVFRDAKGEIEFSSSGRHAAFIYRLTSYG